MLRDSPKVHRAILHRLEQRGISVRLLAKELSIDKKRIYALFNDSYSKYRPIQKDVWRICNYLGIKLILNIKIDDENEVVSKQG